MYRLRCWLTCFVSFWWMFMLAWMQLKKITRLIAYQQRPTGQCKTNFRIDIDRFFSVSFQVFACSLHVCSKFLAYFFSVFHVDIFFIIINRRLVGSQCNIVHAWCWTHNFNINFWRPPHRIFFLSFHRYQIPKLNLI